MSIDVIRDPHLTRRNESDTPPNLMTFCSQLVHHSQWKSFRGFRCGSGVEIPFLAVDSNLFGVHPEQLDMDEMQYSTAFFAVRRGFPIPENYTGIITRIHTDAVHVGYARLIREKDGAEQRLGHFEQVADSHTLHGPAVLINHQPHISRSRYSHRNDIDDKTLLKNLGITSQDLVYAVHSPFWPAEAKEWTNRKRSHGFPSKSIVKRIVEYGCDFVQVSHSRNRNDNEWRFSFSKAEQCIIKSWSMWQRIVYSTLWTLNKRIASSNLCSYYFKTLMLWACEEKSTHFWREDSLVNSVCELLIEIMTCVKSRRCMNYFIPENNMMDHLIDTDLTMEIYALWNTTQKRSLISEIISAGRQCSLMSVNNTLQINLPAWVKRAFTIYQRIDNCSDNYSDLFRTIKNDLKEALFVELSDIYRGLVFQQISTSCQTYFLKSESHLSLAARLCESQERDVIENYDLYEFTAILNRFIICDTDFSGREKYTTLTSNNQPRSTTDRQKIRNNSLLYSRSEQGYENESPKNERFRKSRLIDMVVYIQPKIGRHRVHSSNTKFYNEWPGMSPTVNISWFIARAYLANLYYTTQRDVSRTIKTCDDIIDVYRQSYVNERFAERTFPVVLSTQWTSIYDKEIQELLGFYSLSSYVLDPSSRSVYLGVCPVQFALYLKLRALCLQKELDDASGLRTTWSNIKTSFDNFSDHYSECLCDRYVNNGFDLIAFI